MLWEFRKKVAAFIINPCGRSVPASPTPMPPLYGDRDIEWSWIAAEMPDGPGCALDVGSGGSSLALTATQRGFSVKALDLAPPRLPYVHPRLQRVCGDVREVRFADHSFDLVINCSTVEHVGLAGRYGVTRDDQDGDMIAMQQLRRWTKPEGRMLMTIPVGRDRIVVPVHRIYGKERLTPLLDGWRVAEEQYWAKDVAGTWVQVTRCTALETVGSAEFYALGLFVLRPGR